MEKVIFFRHWFLDQYGTPTCSGWQSSGWCEYEYGHYRDQVDLGNENPINLLRTDKQEFDNW